MFDDLRAKSFWRLLLSVLLPFTLLVLLVVWIVHAFVQQHHIEELSRQADHTMDMAVAMIREDLTHVAMDIVNLDQSSILRRHVQGQEDSTQLVAEWQSFMTRKKYYDQIRLLDYSGMERLRIDYHNGVPLVLPKEALQDKSKRYYFKQAMTLQPGEIYVSALDLNIENGEVVEPFQPTMRFIMQITDRQNRLHGLLALNFSAHQLLQRLRNLSESEGQEVFLANHQGYWMLGPSRESEWGFMFTANGNSTNRLNSLYPDIWADAVNGGQGSAITSKKIMSYRTLNAETPAMDKGNHQLLPFHGSDFPWTIIAVADRTQPAWWGFASVRNFGRFAVPGFIALLLVAAVSFSIWRLALRLHHTERSGQHTRAEAYRLQSILANLQEGIFLVDMNSTIISCNPAAERLYTLEADRIVGQKVSVLLPLLPHNDHGASACPVQAGIYSTEIVLGMGYQRIPVDVTVYDIHNKEGCNSLLIVHDARDRMVSEQRMRYLASHDLLTGLPNRFTLEEETRSVLQNALRHERQVALLYMDIDNFKQVNDTRGHRAGDEFLKRVADRLRLGIPEVCQIGRLGNDEFVILIPEIDDQAEAAELAARIIKLMAEPFTLNTSTYHVGTSIGISFAPQDSDSVEILFQHASTAHHKAKTQGGSTFVFYDPVMNQEAKRLLIFENELRRAKDENQFLLYYQPKKSLVTGEISGVEALLRWAHPRDGLLTPHAFIGKLENLQDLIVDLGYWILEEACSTVVHWNLSRLQSCQAPVTMAVNFSSVQFRDPNMISRIRGILARTGCDSSWLELEITESVLMDDLGSVQNRLWALHDAGISIAIDDFGVGYSSLAYLKKLPVSVLKIDRSFVCGLPGDQDDCAIVEATITMAKHMGLKVVAEGVETETQHEFLKALGIDYLQGYWYAKPMRREKVEKAFLQPSPIRADGGQVVALRQVKVP